MQRFNKQLTIQRRVEGARSPSGEPTETWITISGGTDVSCNFQPLKVGAAAALAQADPGQLIRSSHRILFQAGTDVQVDDRLRDSDGNYFVVQHVARWSTHIDVTCGITDIQV